MVPGADPPPRHRAAPSAACSSTATPATTMPKSCPATCRTPRLLFGDAPAERAWALAELDDLASLRRLRALRALAVAREIKARPAPRKTWPTTYLVPGTQTFYARSHWGDAGVWMVTQCPSTLDVDHMHPNAGNVVLSRGRDDVIVDPSPYGTLSTLTSNAPTVGRPTCRGLQRAFVVEREDEVPLVAADRFGDRRGRCDYADQYSSRSGRRRPEASAIWCWFRTPARAAALV